LLEQASHTAFIQKRTQLFSFVICRNPNTARAAAAARAVYHRSAEAALSAQKCCRLSAWSWQTVVEQTFTAVSVTD
jgi:hypothetical protein